MSRARTSYRVVSVVLCLVLTGFVALSACSNYGEGERCEVLNNNDDCADGLQCTPKAQIVPPFNSSDRCCPVDRATATHAACTEPQAVIGGDAAPLDANTGPTTDGAVNDAPVETSTPDSGGDAADAAEGG